MKKPRTWSAGLVAATFTLFFCQLPAYAAGQPGEYLAYQQPQPAGTSWLSTLAYLISLLVIFALVIGLAYFTSRVLGQKMGRISAVSDSRVIIRLPLGPNRAVCIVEIAGKYLVLGVTDHQINLLQEITDLEQIEKLKATRGDIAANQFDAIFQKHLASLHQMSEKFPAVFGRYNRQQNQNDNEKR